MTATSGADACFHASLKNRPIFGLELKNFFVGKEASRCNDSRNFLAEITGT